MPWEPNRELIVALDHRPSAPQASVAERPVALPPGIGSGGARHAPEHQQRHSPVLPPCGRMPGVGRDCDERIGEGRLFRDGAALAGSRPQLRIYGADCLVSTSSSRLVTAPGRNRLPDRKCARERPAEIVEKLNKEINAGLADPNMKTRLADLGGTVLDGFAR